MLSDSDVITLQCISNDIHQTVFNDPKGKDLKELFMKVVSKVPETGDLLLFAESTDFFTSPASSRYHGAFQFGLLQHSLLVTMLLCEKASHWVYKDLPGVTLENVIISSAMHDLCKADTYVKEAKWRKDSHGKWESYDAWVVKDAFPVGHGDKSALLISRYYKSNPHIDLAVRWHMGLLSTHKPEDFGTAAKKSPLVLLLHTADFESTYLIEGDDFPKNVYYTRSGDNE